jgi:hypothetical protein
MLFDDRKIRGWSETAFPLFFRDFKHTTPHRSVGKFKGNLNHFFDLISRPFSGRCQLHVYKSYAHYVPVRISYVQ